MPKLNLGCGRDIKKGFVNLDCAKLEGVDIVHDLSKFPWPFKDNEFDEIFASHVLEHVDDLIPAMEELHRICKPSGKVEIRVPYFASPGAFADPTHKRFFTLRTFQYFQPKDNLDYYSKARFEIIQNKARFFSSGGILGALSIFPDSIINAMPIFYERFVSGFLPVSEIRAILRPVKPSDPQQKLQ